MCFIYTLTLAKINMKRKYVPVPKQVLYTSPDRVKLRTMTLDLEMFIYIPAASHSAANHPRAHWRTRLNEANMTTEAIMRFLQLTLSALWLRL